MHQVILKSIKDYNCLVCIYQLYPQTTKIYKIAQNKDMLDERRNSWLIFIFILEVYSHRVNLLNCLFRVLLVFICLWYLKIKYVCTYET